jgi:D-serine deaminase-like pyridoxal phosphate-dependent protein
MGESGGSQVDFGLQIADCGMKNIALDWFNWLTAFVALV